MVLPSFYYAILCAEVAGLCALATLRPEESGSAQWSYLFGWAGTASMCLMHVYSIRKRVRAFAHLGRLRTWLELHIFLGLQGALLVTYHSLHLHDVRSIQGVNIVCVGVVVASGIFGRYLYSMIPKSLSGDRLSAREIEAELTGLRAAQDTAPNPALSAVLAAVTHQGEGARELTGRLGFGDLLREDRRARRALRDLDRAVAALPKSADAVGPSGIAEIVAAARRRVLLSRRLATFTAADRLFRGWTVLHKPLTYVLLAATLLHVLAHYMYSAGMSG